MAIPKKQTGKKSGEIFSNLKKSRFYTAKKTTWFLKWFFLYFYLKSKFGVGEARIM